VPTSNLRVAPAIIDLVERVPHHTVLDVGPGYGKYAVLLREYLNVKPKAVDAVEAWHPYVTDHRLGDLYDDVYLGRVQDPVWNPAGLPWVDQQAGLLLPWYDVVLMVDVIEHMSAGDARHTVAQVDGRVVICTPVEFFDNGPGLPPTEEHVSHWSDVKLAKLAAATGRDVEHLEQAHGGWIARLGPTAAGERRLRDHLPHVASSS
jgi:hypothetical protein